MWVVWRERNRRTSEDTEHSRTELIELFYGLLFEWSRVWGYTTTSSLVITLLLSACFMHLVEGFIYFE